MSIPKNLNAFRDAILNQFDNVELRRIADLEKALEADIIEELYDRHHVAIWEWMVTDAVNTNTPDSSGELHRFISMIGRLRHVVYVEPSLSMKGALVTYGVERMARIIIDSKQKETT